ncbi:nucleotidyltransferase domain-containing protein [Paenibacillus chungangensis]|uniref:Nucleotidyltransferase domain-containing protein n=1 Tax=Paenibacillus chungangensis TaxID=696535 RepID=A0ABW3HQW7_9BACL
MVDVKMKEEIGRELQRLEREEGIRILYACESGSRAWGFPSKDSDYDVRFIYARPVEWYLSIFDRRDVIERPISDQLDISGWDVRKALQLFRKSNPPLLEWLQSPIIYRENVNFAARFRQLASRAFSPRSCMHHYVHMAKGNYRDYLQGERVRVKKYFYVLRPILACEWIRRFDAMPPMAFMELVEQLLPADGELRGTVERLLARKMAGEELDMEPKLHVINNYVEKILEELTIEAGKCDKGGADLDEELDMLFRTSIHADGIVVRP